MINIALQLLPDLQLFHLECASKGLAVAAAHADAATTHPPEEQTCAAPYQHAEAHELQQLPA